MTRTFDSTNNQTGRLAPKRRGVGMSMMAVLIISASFLSSQVYASSTVSQVGELAGGEYISATVNRARPIGGHNLSIATYSDFELNTGIANISGTADDATVVCVSSADVTNADGAFTLSHGELSSVTFNYTGASGQPHTLGLSSPCITGLVSGGQFNLGIIYSPQDGSGLEKTIEPGEYTVSGYLYFMAP